MHTSRFKKVAPFFTNTNHQAFILLMFALAASYIANHLKQTIISESAFG
jgi:hypothetical protein